jgi:hypothetical protein
MTNWDAHSFVVLERALKGWPGQQWLDIRRIDLIGPLLETRLDMAQAIGSGCRSAVIL